jgi:hypothetical protein
LQGVEETNFRAATHSSLAEVTTDELRVLKDNPAIIETHVLIFPRVVLFLYNCVDIDVALAVRTKEDIYNLLPSPELNWLENARRRDFNALVSISEVSADSHELGPV